MRIPSSTTLNLYIFTERAILHTTIYPSSLHRFSERKKNFFFARYEQVAWQHKRRRRDATGYKDSWRLQITDANLIIQFTIKHKEKHEENIGERCVK